MSKKDRKSRTDFKKLLEEGFTQEESDNSFEKEAFEGFKSSEIKPDDFDQIMNELDQAIDKKVIEAKEKHHRKRRGVVLLQFRKIAIAASIVLLVSIISLNLLVSKNNGEQIFETYFQPITHVDLTTRSDDSPNLGVTENEAKMAYERGDYKEAVGRYKKLLNQYPNNSKHALFLGISYLSIGNQQKAINLLSRIENVDAKYKHDIEWYLALAYLKNNEKNAAKIILEKLVQEDGFYKKSSEALLKEFK